ncbi:DUF308 domain-containing protein [Streptococcus sp. DD13]|uniref:DUF308 domain-containing protein n=1 Tax=Streptococcus sp. DD13 TaxID=1777881 RepID=UPI000794C2A0|nr:DUF308 domain-containing protein [Streptococcus sp. DD13]KXT78790.1 putative membrane protein [Streptococcus sp. DD13]
MTSSKQFFSLFSGIIYLLIGIIIFVNPIDTLMSLSWLISVGLFIHALNALFNYYRMETAQRQAVYLLEIGINLIFAFYLMTRGFEILPFVVPTAIGIWLLIQATLLYFKGRNLTYVVPFLGSNVKWLAGVVFLLGLIFFLNPMGISLFLMNLIALAFMFAGIQTLMKALRS